MEVWVVENENLDMPEVFYTRKAAIQAIQEFVASYTAKNDIPWYKETNILGQLSVYAEREGNFFILSDDYGDFFCDHTTIKGERI